jgi:hypothetical protein
MFTMVQGAVNNDHSSNRGTKLLRARIERRIAAFEDHDPWRALQ